MKIRKPYVAGRFYPADPEQITSLIFDLQKSEKEHVRYDLSAKKIMGGIVPHAGYVFSGKHAIHFFEIVKRAAVVFDTVVIINPNHTGMGEAIALSSYDFWETPLGKIPVDLELARSLPFAFSDSAHDYEHSAEVMLPFIQYFFPDSVHILPISVGTQNPENALIIANYLHQSVKSLNRDILFIASSDFSHFVHPDKGKEQDMKVIREIEKMDPETVYQTVVKNKISVCGYGPIMALINYAGLASENPKMKLLSYGHSGDIMPSPEVVDYCAMLCFE